MSYKVSHRDLCRLCNSSEVELVVELKPIPPQELYFDSAEEARKVEKFPVDVYM